LKASETVDPVIGNRRPLKPSRQRQVFVALVVNAVPLDALVIELGSNRGAIYKAMFDARRKLRAALAANGYMSHDITGRS
jgi:RNA polymerase sigma-70 factor, ECF subfamily